MAVDPPTEKQARHSHGVKQNGTRVGGRRKTHWNKRGDKPKQKKE